MSNDAMTTLQEQIAKLNQITQNGYSGYKGSTVPIEPGANYTGILENPATKIQQSALAFKPVREADDPLAGYQLPQKEGEAATTPTDYSGVLGKLRWGKNFATSVGQGVADTGTHQIARGGNGIVEWFLDEVGNLPQWVGKEGYNNIDNVRTLLRKEEGYDKLKAAKQKDLLRGGDPSGVTQAASLWGIKMGAEDNEATRGDWNKYFGLRWNRYVNAIRRGEAAVPKDEKAATILAGMKEFEEAHPHKFDVLKPETLVPEAKDQYLVAKDSPEFKQRFDSSNDMADRWGEDATKHVKTMDELSAKALAGKDRADPEYWGYKVGQNAVNYGVAIGATALTKNPTIGAAIVAAPVAGDAYASAREAGYSPEYAASYAALYGAAEYFPEKLAFKKLLAGAGSGILKQTGSNAVMEGMQEGITEIAQMALDQGYKVNDDPSLTFQKAIGRVFDAMVLGGIMGGLGGASHATLNKALATSPTDRAAARDSYLQEFNNIRQALEQGLPQDQLNEIIRNPAPANTATATTAAPAQATPAATASPAPTTPASPAQASPATQATPAAATPANPTDLFSQAEIDFLNDTKNPLNSATDAQSIQGAQDILANPDPALDPYRQNAETLLQEMRTKYDPSSLAPQVQQWEQHRSEGTSMWSTQPSSQATKYSQADNDALINHFSKVIGQGAQVIDTSGILPDGSVLQGEGVTLPDGRVIMNFDNISPQISTVTGQQILSREDRAAIVGNHELSHRAERGFVDSLPDGGQLYNEIRQRLATNQVIGNLARAIQAERVAQVSAGQQATNTLIDDYTAVSEAYAELMGALARPRGYEALVDRYLDYLPRKVKKPALRKLIDKTAAGLRNVFAKWTGKNFTPQTLSNQEVADIFASINNHRYYGLNNTTTAPQQTTQQATGPSTNPISRTGTRQAPVFSTAPEEVSGGTLPVNLKEYTAPKVGKAALHNLLLGHLATSQVEAKQLSLEQLSTDLAQLDLTPFPKAVRHSLYNAVAIVAQQPSQLGSIVSQLAGLHPAYAAQAQGFMEAAVEAAGGLAALPPSGRDAVLKAAMLPISSPKRTTYTFQGQEFTSPPEPSKTPLTITQSMGYDKLTGVLENGGKLYAPSVAIINPENFDGVALGGMDVTFIGSVSSLPENTLLFGADAYTPSFEKSMAGGTPEEIASQIAAKVTASHGSLEARLKEALAVAQGNTTFGNNIVDALISPNMTAGQVEENRDKVGTLDENASEVFHVVNSFLNEYSEAITNTAASIFDEVTERDIPEMKRAIGKEFAHQLLGVPYESMPNVELVDKVAGLREWLAEDIEQYATGLRENTLFRLPYWEGKVLEAMPLSNFKAAVVHTAPSTQEQYDAIDKLGKSGVPVIYAVDNLKEGVQQATAVMPDLLFSTSQSPNVEEDTSTAKPALEDVASTITLAELQDYPAQDTTAIDWEGSTVLNNLGALVAAPPSEVLKGPVLHAVRNGLLDNNQLRSLINNYASHGELPPGYLQYTPASEVARALDYDISAEGQAALSLAYNMRWEKLKEKWTQEARLAGLKRPVQLGSGEIPQHFNVRHMLHSLMGALYTIGSPLPGPSPHSEAELLKKLHVLTETADHVGALYQATMIEALDGAGAELLNEYAQKQSPHVARMLREDWDTLYELRRLAYLHPNTFMEAVDASGLLSNPAYSHTANIGGHEFTSPPVQGKTPFIIVHGMDLDKLQLTLEIGGLAAPSLGIVKSGFAGLEWLSPTVGFIMSPEKLSQLNYIMYRGDSFTPTWNAALRTGGPDTTAQEKSDIIRDLVEDNLGTMEKRINRLAKNGKLAAGLTDLFMADIISGQELDRNREDFEKRLQQGWTDIAFIMGGLIDEIMAANGVTDYANIYENEDLEWFVRSLGLELGWDISPPAPPTTFEVNDQVMAAVKKAAATVREVRNQEDYREVKVTDFVKLEDFTAVQVARSMLNHPRSARLVRELVSMGLVVMPADANSLSSKNGAKATQQLISALPQLTFSLQPPNPNSLQSPELQQKIKEAVEENLLPPWEKIMEQWVATNKLYGGEESWAVAADMGDTELEYEDWVTVRTPAFKKWFGDWEDGKRHSIVVNPRTGEPLKVYHGSLARFDTFSFKHLGSTGSAHGRGFYFTDDPQLAAGYATKDDEVGHIYSGFLNIRRLLGESNKKLRRRDVYNLLHKMVRNGSEILWDFNDLNKYQLETVLSQAVDQLFDTNTNDADILAELGNLDNAEDVHRAFGGSPGYQYILPDGRHYYIALLPNQFKAVNNYGTFSPRQDNMMFSTAPSGSWEEAVQLGRTALSYEDWTTVRTPEFKDWFGDWETDPKNASKVINKETGEPLKVYHGTTAEFDTFRPNEALGGTIFFSPSIEEAKNFATAKGARIISGFLNVRNPRKSPVRSYDEVKAAKAAKQRGQDGIQVYDDIHSPTNWAVFSPQQFKADNSKAFDGNDPRYAYSTAPLQAALATVYSVPPWELREDLPGIGSRTKRLWQVITSDRVKDLWADKQGELERIVKKLPGNALALAVRNGWKAYNAQVQADLVNDILPMQEALAADLAEQLNRVRATIPMYKGMRKSKAMKLFMEHLDKIGKYVYHGEERNVEIALRTGGADLAGSGRTLPEIAEVKQFFMDPARGGGELLTIYENIYNTHIKPMLEYSENRLRAAGLLTPEMEAARPNYKWYIPLYGKPEIEDPTVSHNIDDSFRSRTGGGALARDTLQNRTHNAEGRHGTEAHNLFENIFTQLESTVRRVRAQEPKQRLWEFLQTPEGALAFNATTSQHQLGNQATVNQAGQQTWRNQATADNQVIWQDGNEVHVMTIGNELALNAVKNFNRSLFPYEGNPLAQPGAAAWHGVAWVTRFMGSMYTRYNPSFILRNKMMDSLQQWQYILADAPVGNMTTAAGPRGYVEAVGNVAGRLKLALLAASYNTLWTGTLGKTSGFEQWYKRYEALGGVTTYASFLGRNTLINLANEAWRQAANPIEKALDVKGNLNWLAELLNKANDTMELTTRVSAFRALVESGVEEETAAHYVKDIMNFETKGDLARGINAFYPFFTTSLFDMRRILKTLSHKEGQVLLAALIGISYTMWAALAAATGDDDDGQAWVDKYPMGIASRYAIVPVVSDDGVMRGEGIRVPLGFGLGRIANTIALSWRRYFNGTDEPSDLVSNLINHAAIGSLSPIQPSDVNIKEDPVTWLGNTFLPQVLKPVLQYSSNKNWRGQPIYNPGTFRAEGELDYNTGFAATPDLYKSLAEKLYDGTGYDVAPESIAYWVETAFGGLGRDVVSGTELFLDTTGTGEPPTSSWWRNIPMLSGLTQASPSITREKYFEYRMEVTDEYNRLMDANKRGKSPDAYMRSYGYKKQFDAVEAQLRELRKYRKQVREGLHGAERQAAERQLNDAMQVLQANMVNLYEEQTRRKK